MIERLVSIMARLRDPVDGCAWDSVQTWATIAPYTIEEAYEVADAIARNDPTDLKDELGDLLLQVVFHSRIAEESGAFTLEDVVAAISDKMERRHPHIFGNAASSPGWETIKASERATKCDRSALAGVAIGLPALSRAEKLQKRGARVGFDWPDAEGPIAKIFEEIEEVREASSATVAEEIGDLLFAVTNWARHLGVDPEAALRDGNAKFEARFRAIEVSGGEAFAAMTLDQKEGLWQEVKRRGG
ncbi:MULTISPECIES: nucleoside triphosphate pyrophosphohydrolase [unclassified Sphingomonas]|jgi:ATP diphosphatase|uniref:nucleoside triphosphate pyrophosphohydrolase n=1 Tax=unclassified Sphingomonas TaxID=196159 RepID=UPI0006F6FE5D|nr:MULTISPECIES: nucleoside triphosphate pyrophosphohydrolase [unclassified Sphingomonas]KQN30745.1 nucleoside triphosphate hydrolase [Sphingomonas sp. Leaf34]KQN32816.1 nucleoside triphosphate hydrolase [Sphingomonas sp. Leaf38]